MTKHNKEQPGLPFSPKRNCSSVFDEIKVWRQTLWRENWETELVHLRILRHKNRLDKRVNDSRLTVTQLIDGSNSKLFTLSCTSACSLQLVTSGSGGLDLTNSDQTLSHSDQIFRISDSDNYFPGAWQSAFGSQKPSISIVMLGPKMFKTMRGVKKTWI